MEIVYLSSSKEKMINLLGSRAWRFLSLLWEFFEIVVVSPLALDLCYRNHTDLVEPELVQNSQYNKVEHDKSDPEVGPLPRSQQIVSAWFLTRSGCAEGKARTL